MEKALTILQTLPKWAWYIVGAIGVIGPEVQKYLVGTIGYSPDFVDATIKLCLWLVGANYVNTSKPVKDEVPVDTYDVN